eukprot:NODE_4087_length_1233_cov_48.541441_g3592_i0.p1 GENE.NODE_4087_length_1233_cov_48.541441_g3592_i0~~NODE_4087_length_1233_cov_48.541441_g3592_i0.p1  ORF type:complete len:313 (-),score=75.80 NODE_4087_length_1233_cov_48.541441_g3592_i0:217-1155(-)
MVDTDQQCQAVFDTPATPPTLISECSLYQRLRREEILAYSHLLRSFVGQGLTLDASRLRLLSDIRNMLSISEERHKAELEAAKQDRILKQLIDKRIHSHRNQFSDPTTSSFNYGHTTGTDSGTEDDNREQVTSRDNRRKQQKRPSSSNYSGAPSSKRSEHSSRSARRSAPPPQPPTKEIINSKPVEADKTTLDQLGTRMSNLQRDINQLQMEMENAEDEGQKAILMSKLETSMEELNTIIDLLGNEDNEPSGGDVGLVSNNVNHQLMGLDAAFPASNDGVSGVSHVINTGEEDDDDDDDEANSGLMGLGYPS